MSQSNSNRHTPFFVTAIFVAIAIIALGLACGGCASASPFRPVVPQLQTNQVVTPVLDPIERIEWRTNTVVITNVVAGERLVVTNFITTPALVITNEVHWVTNTVVTTNSYVVNPDFSAALETARRANSALNPTPSAPFVDWGITLLGGVATVVAGWQTRKAAKANAAADQASLVADTVIKGIETYPGSELDRVKEHIARVSQLTGAVELVDERVQAISETVSGALADGRIDALELGDLANNLRVKEADIPERYREAFRELRQNVLAAASARVAA